MKKIILIAITLTYLSAFSMTESAHTIEKGKYEIGLFQPLKYGYSETLEISTHPISFFLMPNITFKRMLPWGGDIQFASKHSVYYPTLLLRTLTREGTGGFIAPDPTIPEVPHMFSVSNELIATKTISSLIVSGKVGFAIAVTFGDDLDSRTEIEFPTIYPRLGVYYNGNVVNMGLDIRKNFGKFDILVDGDVFLLPGYKNDFFFEHKGMLIWNATNSFQISTGAKAIYGEYTGGNKWDLTGLFDFVWRW
jgi:hypothetical protein